MLGTSMIEKTPEDEAFEDIERRARVAREVADRGRVKSFEDAFGDHLKTLGVLTTSVEEARRHFNAGWVAGVRNEWAKERND